MVLHGGATAFFRTSSLLIAGQLGGAIAQIPDLLSRGVKITLSDDGVSVRLTRDLWQLEDEHLKLAQTVSSVARVHGAAVDPSAVQEIQVAVSAKADSSDVAFWKAVLGYVPMADDNAVDPLGHGSTVWMQDLPQATRLRRPAPATLFD